ncbi:tyrosine-type recombinase/integrase [Cohnella soli]|uniref:Tyrosine-type recombinase/integrase n=1 Tax=Cohnella soli TaxID=425005 RepID=A0ABW0HNY9_9BACL
MAQLARIPTYADQHDHLEYWIGEYLVYLEHEGTGELQRTKRFLYRFLEYIRTRYDGNDQVSILVSRDTKAFLKWLHDKESDGGCNYSVSYVNSHHVEVGLFLKWLGIRAPLLLPNNPIKGVSMVRAKPEPEAKALLPRQITSLLNIADRLPILHTRKNARPYRDRAIIYVLLDSGLRRHELTGVDLVQLIPYDVEQLKNARRVKLIRVRGKRKTERTVYLSAEGRSAVVDYLEKERHLDDYPGATALFLSSGPSQDKRLHVRTINKIVEQVGRWHDAAFPDPDRSIAPLSPHDLRHTCASELRRNNPKMTDEDLMIYMGWVDKDQLLRYTKAKEEVISWFVEQSSQGRK